MHDAWAAERLARFRLAPDVSAMVERVQAAGYRTGVVTNGHADVQRAKIGACGLARLFGERIIVSGEQPRAKPDASIFATALALVGARADETIMVGDSLAADVQGGINAGLLATVWVRADGGGGGADGDGGRLGGPRPSHVVRSVLDLESVLERL